jgi:hypothetical protein
MRPLSHELNGSRNIDMDQVKYTGTIFRAAVVELVDTLALGASASGREGSSPFCRTNLRK